LRAKPIVGHTLRGKQSLAGCFVRRDLEARVGFAPMPSTETM
jgi:hypothetical protein